MKWILKIYFNATHNPEIPVELFIDDLSDISWYVNAYPDSRIDNISIERIEGS